MTYSDLMKNIINKIMGVNKRNFLTNSFDNESSIRNILAVKFPEFGELADEEMELDYNALNRIDRTYNIEVAYEIRECKTIEKILDYCIKNNLGYNVFTMSIALLEHLMIHGPKDIFGHQILTMEYVMKFYVDDFVDNYTSFIKLKDELGLPAEDEENDKLKTEVIMSIITNEELLNIILSQSKKNDILLIWLSDFNDLLLYHYFHEPNLNSIVSAIPEMVSYLSADIRIYNR